MASGCRSWRRESKPRRAEATCFNGLRPGLGLHDRVADATCGVRKFPAPAVVRADATVTSVPSRTIIMSARQGHIAEVATSDDLPILSTRRDSKSVVANPRGWK